MDTAKRVQTLGEANRILHNTNAFGKYMNLIILTTARGK